MVTITFNTVNVETGDINFCSPVVCVYKDPRDVYRCLDKIVSAFNAWRSVYPLYSVTEESIYSVLVTNTSPADLINISFSSSIVKIYIPSLIRERYNVPVCSGKSLSSYVSKCFIEVSKKYR